MQVVEAITVEESSCYEMHITSHLLYKELCKKTELVVYISPENLDELNLDSLKGLDTEHRGLKFKTKPLTDGTNRISSLLTLRGLQLHQCKRQLMMPITHESFPNQGSPI